MALSRGLRKSDYQDILRTVGHYIDNQRFTHIRLIETEEGVILQGRPSGAAARRAETYLLTLQEIREMRQDAYQRRGTRL
ncbi:MAG: hypothetical protein ACE5NC_02175 [Anaerolineae bacterium]